jgi:hypothetical protein
VARDARRGIATNDIETIAVAQPDRVLRPERRLGDLRATAAVDQRELWQGNSVLRGQAPRVDS